MATITITNKNATATTLLVDGVNTPISGSGSITVDEGVLIRLQADPVARLRFLPAGDLTHTSPAPSGGGATQFSAVVDLTTTAPVSLVPAVPGRSWVTRQLRIALVHADGGVTAATLAVQSGGNMIEGVTIDGTFQPFFSFFAWATAAGAGVDLQATTAATGGAISAEVGIVGQYT